VVHLHSGPSVLYPDCLLPSPPCGATGTGLFRREPSNSAGGTFTHERNHLHGLLRCETEFFKKQRKPLRRLGEEKSSAGWVGKLETWGWRKRVGPLAAARSNQPAAHGNAAANVPDNFGHSPVCATSTPWKKRATTAIGTNSGPLTNGAGVKLRPFCIACKCGMNEALTNLLS